MPLPPKEAVFFDNGQRPSVAVAVLAATVFCAVPLALNVPVPPTEGGLGLLGREGMVLGACLPLLVVACCYWRERQIDARDKVGLFALLTFLTMALNRLHFVIVDSRTTLFAFSNDVWQRQIHELILSRSPGGLPHSYRFLADTTIRWLEYLTGDYSYARIVFRNTFVFLLLYAIYKFARLHVRHAGGMLTLLLYACVYPFSIERYSGQPIDPLSHLSFVLSFIFLARNQFVYFLLALGVGSLAKETVLAMAGFYVLSQWSTPRYLVKSLILFAAVPACYLGVRAFILQGMLGYSQVAGTTLEHLNNNLNDPDWFPLTALTVGLFLPFFLLAFKTTPRVLRGLVLYLSPVIFVSSLYFSWLAETRNWVPVVVPLAVITARHLLGSGGAELPDDSRPREAQVIPGSGRPVATP